MDDPVLYQVNGAMDETEVIATLNDIADVIATYVGMWLSFTFAYLTVAYFVGKALSRFQCLTISLLYAIASAWFCAAGVAYTQAWQSLRAREESLYDTISLMTAKEGWEWGISIFLIGGTLVSLYFMYDIRKRVKNATH